MQAQSSARRNLLLVQEMFLVMDLLQRHGIRSIAYKGASLAVIAYGDVAVRPFNDIDLVLDRENVFRAGTILRDAGFLQEMPLSTAEERLYLRSECELNFVSPLGAQVELHWAIAPSYCVLDIPPELLLDQPEIVGIAGRLVASIAPDMLLLALCIHGVKHGWKQWSMIADIAALMQARPGLRWNRLIAVANHIGALGCLHLGVLLADRWLGADVPAQLAVVRAGQAEASATLSGTEANLFAAPGMAATAFDDARGQLMLHIRERLRDRILFLQRLVLIPNAAYMLFIRLPDRLSWAYPMVRSLRMGLKLGTHLGILPRAWLDGITARDLSRRELCPARKERQWSKALGFYIAPTVTCKEASELSSARTTRNGHSAVQ